ncbi:MAG: TIGR04190 family B12-binding domain/radical SAM domain protein [Methanomassiliicoccus sp.]|nr:TIGR04190 family B12-binding domain/radical SAM domain protein [Methanomassiliicoccus sp.]
MHREDIIFLHAPSVYDFRKRSIFYGPVSDLVPSTPVFEMYPFGFTTMANRLSKEGYRVRIINLASMMLNDRRLDVEALLGKLRADVFGIDLHWLPHAHGSLAVADIVKKLHPESKVLFGGFSSSYFHEELITYPQVDLVLRGDSVEEPLANLMAALEKGGDLSSVPNLTWKRDGKVTVNPLTCVPEDLDYLDIDYGWIIKSVIRHRDLEGAKPFKDWDRYPLTAVFTVRGCNQSCAVCGGSCGAMRRVLGRTRPAFRSPENVAQDIADVQAFIDAPVFVVGDVRQNGDRYSERFFRRCRELGVDDNVVLELFTPAPASYFEEARQTFDRYSIQFSPDSHEEKVRNALGRRFDNASMEKSISNALANDCQRFDMFFMIGLPEQTPSSAIESANYTRKLYAQNGNDHRLLIYTSPLAPFLDPGSFAFENPGKFGYRLFARTLEEHRARLENPNWRDVLSYETVNLTRDQIVQASYDAADLLNQVRVEVGLMTAEELKEREARSMDARQLMGEVDLAMELKDRNEREATLARLKQRGDDLMESTICQKRDLEWDSPSVFRSIPKVMYSLVFRRRPRSG